MKSIMALIFLACLLCCEKSAPDREAEKGRQLFLEHELMIPEKIVAEEYTEELKSWLSSLYKGLGYNKANTGEEIFLRCDIRAKAQNSTYAVYQSTKNKKRFYIFELGYVIDFESQKIGTLGVAGISIHYPPSKRIVVLLCPTKTQGFMGVLLGDYKTDSPNPRFTENKVSF